MTLVFMSQGLAQVDSLIALLEDPLADTTRIDVLGQLSTSLFGTDTDQSLVYGLEAKTIAEQIGDQERLALMLKNVGIAHYYKGDFVDVLEYWSASLAAYKQTDNPEGIANILSNIGAVYNTTGDHPKALEYFLEALKMAEKANDQKRKGTVLQNIGAAYSNKSEIELAKDYYGQALEIFKEIKYDRGIGMVQMNLTEAFTSANQLDEALKSAEEARNIFAEDNDPNLAEALTILSKIHLDLGAFSEAEKWANQSYNLALRTDNNPALQKSATVLGQINNKKGQYRSAIRFLKQSVELGHELEFNIELQGAYEGLIEAYRKSGDLGLALIAQDSMASVIKEVYNIEKDQSFSNLQLKFDLEKRDAALEQLKTKNELREIQIERAKTSRNLVISMISFCLIGAFGFFMYLQNKKLDKKVTERTSDLTRSLADLKATQTRLIHSEKMASLGELTAGIAHEIQNPLNFVNNFSEVSGELLGEMKEELDNGDKEEALAIADDVIQNLEKITHHGKRADSIVKGMLQHSRTNIGKKEATDINVLCDEFLRLAYHGLRAKDKGFNAYMTTDFDADLGKVEIRPQEMGRVILNLVTNAFYAVSERKTSLTQEESDGYDPKVTISTHKEGDMISIKISDNGNGIPEEIKSKIFQPFFTTKPTGEGTGLGLSMSYDIVKSHGGELKMESVVGKGSEFVIQIPLQ